MLAQSPPGAAHSFPEYSSLPAARPTDRSDAAVSAPTAPTATVTHQRVPMTEHHISLTRSHDVMQRLVVGERCGTAGRRRLAVVSLWPGFTESG